MARGPVVDELLFFPRRQIKYLPGKDQNPTGWRRGGTRCCIIQSKTRYFQCVRVEFSGLFDDLIMDHSGLIDKSENGGIAVPNDVDVINRCMECVRSYSRRHLFCQWS